MATMDKGIANLQRSDTSRNSEKLKKSLNAVQVFFIIVSTVIGTGVFTGNGIALAVAGPVGLLLNVVGVGLVAVCVAETVSELTQLWTVPNAVYYYIKYFVDTEAAWVVTALYWYSYSAVFAVQMLGAANLVQFWDLTAIWPPFIFYLIVPILLLSINLAGISFYGWVETVCGMLKTILIFGVICTLFDISTKNGYAGSDGPISSGLQFDAKLTTRKSQSFFYGIPQVTYSYIGIESAAIAAFESIDAQAVSIPSQFVHWLILVLYFLCSLGIALTVRWDDVHLTHPLADLPYPRSNSPTIIAIGKDARLGITPLPAFVNGCLIMSTVSAAAASLYLAGRTLYGLAFGVDVQESNWVSRTFKGLSVVWEKTTVPAKALLVTVLAFFWLPWLSEAPQGKGFAARDVQHVLGMTASMSCIITWAFLCLAFIRFQRLAKRCETSPTTSIAVQGLSRYVQPKRGKLVRGVGAAFQPWPATVGFLGCVIVSISASAPWWAKPARTRDVLAAYGPVRLPPPVSPSALSRTGC
ncbi:amino acid permease-domain-containing protein [Cercophora newfieldiana]|uniref:Amino acid permease-domain-containing protein n=1 Tax=Cercophora newfieldiana TaxID=92897 RepID=A0AA39Y3V2_9PEZI|nr:amino acid permease-domain-containing protein [Cercophora newfieldiana]